MPEQVGTGGFAQATLYLLDPDGNVLLDPDGNSLIAGN